MFRLRWDSEALNYLKGNRGLVNELEIAILELRGEPDAMPMQGKFEQLEPVPKTRRTKYLWAVAEHLIVFLHDEIAQVNHIELIKPFKSEYDIDL